MRLHTRLALSLVAALSAPTAAQEESPHAKPVQEPAPAAVAGPMASFARLIPGAWQVTYGNGTTSFTTWHWGPGKHSIRANELEVYYWHPGLEQVRILSLHPDLPGIGRGVGEGTLTFDGDTANGVFDLYQPGQIRKMGLRWTFDGPDEYRDSLLEANGPEGLQPLNEWDFFRVQERSEARPRTDGDALKPSEHLKALEPLVGGTWEAKGHSPAGDAFHIQSTFERVPDYVHARVLAPSSAGEPTHLLDAYFYEHVGTGALRCLALSSRGGVYEGDVTAVDGGALELHLKGYEGDRVVSHVVRFDFEPSGTLRNRVWSLAGTERELLLDVHHAKLEPQKD